MTKPDPKRDDALLEALFAEARADQPDASPDLLARVLADAEAEQAARAAVNVTPQTAPGGVFTRLAEAIGGWPSMAGMATAACAGLWFGFASPETVDVLANGYLGVSDSVDLVDLMTGLDTLQFEG